MSFLRSFRSIRSVARFSTETPKCKPDKAPNNFNRNVIAGVLLGVGISGGAYYYMRSKEQLVKMHKTCAPEDNK